MYINPRAARAAHAASLSPLPSNVLPLDAHPQVAAVNCCAKLHANYPNLSHFQLDTILVTSDHSRHQRVLANYWCRQRYDAAHLWQTINPLSYNSGELISMVYELMNILRCRAWPPVICATLPRKITALNQDSILKLLCNIWWYIKY